MALISPLKAQNLWESSLAYDGTVIRDLNFINPNTGFVIGADSHGVIAVSKTTDKGRNWVYIHSNWPSSWTYFCSVYFVNENTGFAAYNNNNATPRNVIRKTTNAGDPDPYWWTTTLSWLPRSEQCKIRFSDVNHGLSSLQQALAYTEQSAWCNRI